jgi:hypothetical protein
MAQPSTRTELINYCKRQLGAPVLEINVAEEQVEDLVDDAVQFFKKDILMVFIPHFLNIKLLKVILTEVDQEVDLMLPLESLQPPQQQQL